jgi:hypothetical protein
MQGASCFAKQSQREGSCSCRSSEVAWCAHLPRREPMRGEARRLPGEEPSRPLPSAPGLLPSSQPAGRRGEEGEGSSEHS